MKMAVFCVVAPCSLVEVYRRFRGTCCLQGDRPDAQTLSELNYFNNSCLTVGFFSAKNVGLLWSLAPWWDEFH
jgi:hypothetical protein